MTVDIRDSN